MGRFFHSPEERWERIAQVLLWVAGLFGAFTIHGIYSGDDWRGLVMTVVPGVLCLGLWYTARVRLDHLVSESRSPMWVRIVGWTFSAGALATVAWLIYGLSSGRLEYREAKTDKQREDEVLRSIRVDRDVIRLLNEVEAVSLPDGGITVRRKQTVTEGEVAPAPENKIPRCPDGQTLVADPTAPDRPVCK